MDSYKNPQRNPENNWIFGYRIQKKLVTNLSENYISFDNYSQYF